MVGHVQSRKVRDVPPLFDWMHSVDSVKIAEKLSGQVGDTAEPMVCLVQVNVSGEDSKGGLVALNWQQDTARREALLQAMDQIICLPGLKVSGLMTMAPIVNHVEQTRPVFARLYELRDMIQDALDHPLPELSMGMTNDYGIAIEEGATMVRIGRAIFGERD